MKKNPFFWKSTDVTPKEKAERPHNGGKGIVRTRRNCPFPQNSKDVF